MKKLIFLLFSLLLVSCGKSDSLIEWIKTQAFIGSGFSIHIPETWSSTGNTSISTGIGIPVLSAISPKKQYNFSSNIVIILDDLKFLGTSAQYSEQNHTKTKKSYLDHKDYDQGLILFSDDDTTKYFIFDAKYNTNTPQMRFIQTAKVCGTKVYLMHASIGKDIDSDAIIKIFRTFQCK